MSQTVVDEAIISRMSTRTLASVQVHSAGVYPLVRLTPGISM
jgi:hypothetical protein